MTAAPFRELFVELPAALFESLQAIGEAAVTEAEARRRPSPPPKLERSLFSQRYIRLALRRYGWLDAELLREVTDDAFTLIALLPCLHPQRFQIDGFAIATCRGPQSEIDLLDSIVDSTPRRCYCVPRPEGP